MITTFCREKTPRKSENEASVLSDFVCAICIPTIHDAPTSHLDAQTGSSCDN